MVSGMFRARGIGVVIVRCLEKPSWAEKAYKIRHYIWFAVTPCVYLLVLLRSCLTLHSTTAEQRCLPSSKIYSAVVECKARQVLK